MRVECSSKSPSAKGNNTSCVVCAWLPQFRPVCQDGDERRLDEHKCRSGTVEGGLHAPPLNNWTKQSRIPTKFSGTTRLFADGEA